jgi:hypothetical protein
MKSEATIPKEMFLFIKSLLLCVGKENVVSAYYLCAGNLNV